MSQAATGTIVTVDGHVLNYEQLRVFDLVIRELSSVTEPLHLLVHGSAGTGKSLLLKTIRDEAKQKFGCDSCVVTALIAIGAQQIDSRTINSTFLLEWETSNKQFMADVTERKFNQLLWMRSAKILLIDGINYVNAEFFARLDHRLQEVFGVSKPFGGLSVIVFGDFHQLPPVEGNWIFEGLEEKFIQKRNQKTPNSSGNLWSLFKIVELIKNERIVCENQAKVLESMRNNPNDKFLWEYLKIHCFLVYDVYQTPFSILHKLNELCENHPDKSFAVLASSKEVVCTINDMIIDQFPTSKNFKPEFNNMRYPRKGDLRDMNLKVAENCKVVLTYNYKEYSINHGSIGTVEDFSDDVITVRFSSGVVPVHRIGWYYGNKEWEQFPLRLAYAFTVERSQGMTFDGVVVVRNKTWDRQEMCKWMTTHNDDIGELYTAFSRARNLELCSVTPLRKPEWRVSEKARNELIRMRRDCQL